MKKGILIPVLLIPTRTSALFTKVILFLQLLQAHGPYYFDSIRNWDKEKNKLLEAYGYSLSDDLKGKFEFSYKEGKPFLRVLDTSIKRVNPAVCPGRNKLEKEVVEEVMEPEQKLAPVQRLGVVFNFNHDSLSRFSAGRHQGKAMNNKRPMLERLKNWNWPSL